MKKIAVITSGGDAPGMNACIRAIVLTANQHGMQVIGFRHGFRGIVEDLNQPLHPNDMRLVSQRGGTILLSSRYPEFKQVSAARDAAAVLDKHNIGALIVIGGDGSFRGAHHLDQHWDGQVIGLPGTIDNDLAGTDTTIGFATAVDTAMEAIDRIRETAEAMARVFLIEVMGRHAGFIGLHAAIAGSAEGMLVPELEPQPKLAEIADRINQARAAFPDSSYLIVVSENLWPGGVENLARELTQATGTTCHSAPLGHIQRGGRPNAEDRILSMQLGQAAVHALMDGLTGHMIGVEQGHVVQVPIHLTFQRDKPLDPRLVDLQLGLQQLNFASKVVKESA